MSVRWSTWLNSYFGFFSAYVMKLRERESFVHHSMMYEWYGNDLAVNLYGPSTKWVWNDMGRKASVKKMNSWSHSIESGKMSRWKTVCMREKSWMMSKVDVFSVYFSFFLDVFPGLIEFSFFYEKMMILFMRAVPFIIPVGTSHRTHAVCHFFALISLMWLLCISFGQPHFMCPVLFNVIMNALFLSGRKNLSSRLVTCNVYCTKDVAKCQVSHWTHCTISIRYMMVGMFLSRLFVDAPQSNTSVVRWYHFKCINTIRILSWTLLDISHVI